jgi:hypothetical protein
MSDDQKLQRRKTRRGAAVGLLAAGAIAGGVLASTLGASAASGTASTGAATAVATAVAPAAGSGVGGSGHGGATPVRSDEKQQTGATASTLRAAALKAVPGGTVYRIETDAGDGTYEAHMTKADGTLVTVKFDGNMKVTKVESGMGTGDPAPAGPNQPGSSG